mmetsp:Transcript_100939/g.290268  ORF Transcript_100939/g.290268 Transcript_100939/m.290268 type:complete len:217 (+) Transcript_100939:1883-2533(+)
MSMPGLCVAHAQAAQNTNAVKRSALSLSYNVTSFRACNARSCLKSRLPSKSAAPVNKATKYFDTFRIAWALFSEMCTSFVAASNVLVRISRRAPSGPRASTMASASRWSQSALQSGACMEPCPQMEPSCWPPTDCQISCPSRTSSAEKSTCPPFTRNAGTGGACRYNCLPLKPRMVKPTTITIPTAIQPRRTAPLRVLAAEPSTGFESAGAMKDAE